MFKKIISISVVAFMLCFINVTGQLQIDKQIREVPPVISAYVDGYMHDLSSYQGISYLNSISSTARVLPQWAIGFSLRMGAGVTTPHAFQLPESPNFEYSGVSPSLFSEIDPGTLQYFLIDPDEGYRLVHPFTGEYIGFDMDFFETAATGTAIAPSVIPTLTLGIGFGTEISAGVLPGLLKTALDDMGDEFSIDKDMVYALGIRHDVFNWIPSLNERNYHLTVGLNYSSTSIDIAAAEDAIGEMNNISSDYFSVENGLTGLEYSVKATGFEVMAGKSFGWVDLSVFLSSNSNKYTIESVGDLYFKYASDFYANDIVYKETVLENIVDASGTINRTLMGGAVQLNLGRFNISGKYAFSDEDYLSFGLGFVFGKYKKEAKSE